MSREVRFGCECCRYYTNTKKHYDAHLLTKKHASMEKKEINTPFECKFCKKTFKSNSGLWKHNQKCNTPVTTVIKNNITNITNNNITNNNITNNITNVNLFLNTDCKDAITICDFVRQLKVAITDLSLIVDASNKNEIAKAIGDIIVKNNKARKRIVNIHGNSPIRKKVIKNISDGIIVPHTHNYEQNT